VGDALGAALEWLSPEQIAARYGGPLRDMVASSVWERGEWTDDTSMMLALGESLAERGDWDEDDVVARYAIWARSGPKDIGGTVSHALRRAGTAELARASAAEFHELSGGKSAGNGSLMRTAPIAIRFRDSSKDIERVSRADSVLTHHDPLAGDACAFFNLTLAALIRGKKLPKKATTEAGRVALAAREASPQELLDDVQRRVGFVLTALRVAYACGLGCDGFEEAVVTAANMGGDADTNAAVTGALAGARFGAEAIPERWLEPLRQRERVGGLATRLLRRV